MANTNWSFRIPRGNDWTILIGGTETTICLFYAYADTSFIIRIFEIPLRTPVSDNEDELPEVAAIFEFKDPTVIPVFSQSPDSWYFGRGDVNPPPFYLNVRDWQTGKLSRYTLDITRASDLSDLSPSPFVNSGSADIPNQYDAQVVSYRMCGNSSVHVVSKKGTTAAITVGFESSKCHDSSHTATAHVDRTDLAQARIKTFPPDYFCPASGRLVYVNDSAFVISDFL